MRIVLLAHVRRRLRPSYQLQCVRCYTDKSTKPYTPIHTRYAPSPTGSLHLGGLRTALFNWLLTRSHNRRHPNADVKSTFVIRMEDTDRKRLKPESANNLLTTLSWFGIQSDAPVIYQSTRLSVYQQRAHELVDRGHAYACTCSAERLESLRNKGVPYDGFCSHLSVDESAQRLRSCIDEKIPHTIRMRVPKTGATTVHDIIHGAVTFANSAIDDQVILKSDGFPTYHLAVVVDDHAQGITHVIRGDEWLPSAPKHIILYKYFDWTIPQYVHLPLLLRADGGKLSKRHADSSVSYYIDNGFLRDGILNYVAMLGWNDGSADEIFLMDDLIQRFTIYRCQQSSAIVDINKMRWINQQHLRKLINTDIEQIINIIKPQIKLITNNHYINDNYIIRALRAVRDNVFVMSDCITQTKIFFQDDNIYYTSKTTQQLRRKVWIDDNKCIAMLIATKDTLLKSHNNNNREQNNHIEKSDEISMNEEQLRLSSLLKNVLESFSLSTWTYGPVTQRQYYGLIRYALTGVDVGMGISLIMSVMGHEQVMRRIQFAIDTQAFKQQDESNTGTSQLPQTTVTAHA